MKWDVDAEEKGIDRSGGKDTLHAVSEAGLMWACGACFVWHGWIRFHS